MLLKRVEKIRQERRDVKKSKERHESTMSASLKEKDPSTINDATGAGVSTDDQAVLQLDQYRKQEEKLSSEYSEIMRYLNMCLCRSGTRV